MTRKIEILAIATSLLCATWATANAQEGEAFVAPIEFELTSRLATPAWQSLTLRSSQSDAGSFDASTDSLRSLGSPSWPSSSRPEIQLVSHEDLPIAPEPPESLFEEELHAPLDLDTVHDVMEQGPLESIDRPPAIPVEESLLDNSANSVVADDDSYELMHFGQASHWLPMPGQMISRFGWWGVSSEGDPTKIGEYQSLNSSPFWDVDGLLSNGLRTFDFTASGFDDESSLVRTRYIGPRLSIRSEFQRFPHRLNNDPLSEFTSFDQQPPNPLPPAPRNFRVMKEDLNVGDDFAIRVQELNTSFEGKLTQKMKWKLNMWGMRKKGERQVTAMAHCFSASNATDSNGNPVTGVSCHVLSQSQRIDWLTMEVEPVLTGKFGPTTVEYSHTLRSFSQDDQVTTRPYDGFGFTGDLPYAVVPENVTNIDRLRIGLDTVHHRSAYALLYHGNTENKLRDVDRSFRGFDVRATDSSVKGVSVTGYAKNYVQTGDRPSTLLPEESNGSISSPIGYDRITAGVRGRWRPLWGNNWFQHRFLLSGGYEFQQLERENALFVERALTVDQSHTTANSIFTRASMNWTRYFDSYIKYRVAFVDDPLYGVPIGNTTTNSSLPTQEHLVEIGGTWYPTDTLMVSASYGANNRWHSPGIANFREDDYPITFTAWYSPTLRWSISGGLAFYSNWIDQDITLGSKSNPFTAPWSFTGTSDVVNIGTTFAWTKNLVVTSGLDYFNGKNLARPPAGYMDLAPFSDVIVETTRIYTGLDYKIRPGIAAYVRYQYFDYEDESQDYNSGTTDMLLGGFSAFY